MAGWKIRNAAGTGIIDVDGIKLSGGTLLTPTATEINVLHGVTAGTVTASKVVVVDSSSKVDVWDATTLKIGGTSLITAAKLNGSSVNVHMADANTAGSVYVVVPYAGTITGLSVVNFAANTTTKTVFTAKIATVSVTHPAWEVAVTAAAGVGVTVVPTAANTVTAGAVVEIASDGGGSPVMPCQITLTILRT